jgi:hypothetical protein
MYSIIKVRDIRASVQAMFTPQGHSRHWKFKYTRVNGTIVIKEWYTSYIFHT